MKTYPPIETFLSLRRWIGYVGISLPWLVALLAWKIQPSISDFYYTGSRNWFVGSLFTIGAFLYSYYGYDRRDRIMSVIAGVCAFGVALFPTDSGAATLIGDAHYASAASLFLILAWFSLVQFTKSSHPAPTEKKLKRNAIYRACGYAIIGALSFILLLKLTGLGEKFGSVDPVFWLESVALEAFGFSWMVKGEFILRDDEESSKTTSHTAGPTSIDQGELP